MAKKLDKSAMQRQLDETATQTLSKPFLREEIRDILAEELANHPGAEVTVAKHDPEMTHVILFGDGAFDFVIDESEDQCTLTSTVAVLSKASNSLMRVANACGNRQEMEEAQLENTLAEARVGIEFLSGMCACLSDDLARRAGVDHG